MKTIAVLLTVVAAAAALEQCVCTYEYSPVCGSDGFTYPNMCFFRCQQRKDVTLTLAHHGVCQPIFAKRSEEPCFCTKEYRPVCGSDAVTYDNRCLLKCAAKSGKFLFELQEGVCEDILLPLCPCDWEYNPVCGSNAKTYTNSCILECEARFDNLLYVIYDGPCRIGQNPYY